MLNTLKCSFGHQWQPASSNAEPLVCPTCGGAPVFEAGDGAGVGAVDNERTLDFGPANHSTLHTPPPPQASATPPPVVVTTMTNAVPLKTDASISVSQDMTISYTPTPTPASPHASSGGGSVGGSGGGGGGAGRSIAPVSGTVSPSNKATAGMPFVIVRQHARGGLGVVSLARDDQIKREVALKQVLPQHIDNQVLKRRFLYEAQITGQLEHPSIVPVYTLGNDDASQPYYVMRFVKGRTLDEIIKEHHSSPNPIVMRELLRRYIAVCQAVAYAHSRGVIHRDLKPANIMLGDYGETLVLDWGLAKDIKHPSNDPALWSANTPHLSAGTTMSGSRANQTIAPSGATPASTGNNAELTMEGQLIGTPAYMAPEQAQGKTELHAPTTDIYALGGILYKILTGQSPNAPTASTTGTGGARRLTFVPSPPPSQANKDVHPKLDAICTRAMATDPGARYQRALEVADDIQRWLDQNPLSVRARTSGGRMVALLRAHVVGIVLTLSAVIAGLVVLLILHK